MRFTVSTKDPIEARRLAKALDLAFVIWEFHHNVKADERTAEELKDEFYNLLENNGIMIDDLIE